VTPLLDILIVNTSINSVPKKVIYLNYYYYYFIIIILLLFFLLPWVVNYPGLKKYDKIDFNTLKKEYRLKKSF